MHTWYLTVLAVEIPKDTVRSLALCLSFGYRFHDKVDGYGNRSIDIAQSVGGIYNAMFDSATNAHGQIVDRVFETDITLQSVYLKTDSGRALNERDDGPSRPPECPRPSRDVRTTLSSDLRQRRRSS